MECHVIKNEERDSVVVGIGGNVYNWLSFGIVGNSVCRTWENCILTDRLISGFPVRFCDPVWLASGMMTDSDCFHDTVNSAFTGNIHIFRLLQCQCLIHADTAISIVAFILRKNLFHGIRQWLIFPWAGFVCKILVKSLSADMEGSAEKKRYPLLIRRLSFLMQ